MSVNDSFIRSYYGVLNESKKVGILYHFTSVPSLIKLLENDFQFKTSNDSVSLTRNFRLPKDASITGNHGISDAYGTVARITLDGDKLSNNFKLTPVRGLIDPSIQDILSSGLKRVDRKHNENEELLTGKRGYNLSKYVKSVEVLYRQEFLSKNDQDTIEKICHKKGVALSFLRMWEPVKEDASYHVNEYLLEGIL